MDKIIILQQLNRYIHTMKVCVSYPISALFIKGNGESIFVIMKGNIVLNLSTAIYRYNCSSIVNIRSM